MVNDRGKPALDTPFGKVGAGVDLNIPGLQLPRGRQGLIGVNKVFWIVLEGENLGDCEVSGYVTGTFKVNGNLTPTPIKKPLEGKFPVTPHKDYIDPQRDGLIVPPGIAPHEIQTGDGVIVIADAPGIVPSPELTRLDFSYHFLIDVKSS